MATNIDKGLYSAPVGIADELALGGAEANQPLEIEIVNPERVTLDDGSVEITLEPGAEGSDEEFDANLAEYMDDAVLGSLAQELDELVTADINSRKDWADVFIKGLEVLGLKYEQRTEPWDGACGVFSTVLAEAAIRFQSETIMETFPASGPVKTEVMGAIDKPKEEAAERVREDMNYTLTEKMVEYRSEHERMLFSLGLAGAAFKKVYPDPTLDRPVAMFVPAEEIIIPYGAPNLDTAERVAHLMRKTKNDVKKLQVAGFYKDVELGNPVNLTTNIEKKKADESGFTITQDDDRYQLAEVHVDWDMPGYEDPDGIARPYVITYDRGTKNVLAIRRNWKEEDPLQLKRQHFVQYNYIPGFGVYGMGLIHIIGGYARAGTSIIRQLVDAGTLSNLPGGLKTRGARIKGDDTPISPGEFRDVDVPSGAIKDNIMSLPYKEPSQVLAGLLEKITQEARRLGSIADMSISDMSAQAPVGTTLALIERQLKTMGAVQARVHYAMKQEFKLLKEIIRDYTPEEYSYDPNFTKDRQIKKSDYDLVEVIPVSDPNSSTMAQRIMQYQAVLQLASQAPQIYDLPQLHRQMIEVLGVPNADKLVPTEDDQKPRDPISENMDILNGKPVKAFIYQDHDAHIATHSAFMRDPMIAQQMGQNPKAQLLFAAGQAHIAEHLGFAYRRQVEERLGVSMPAPDTDMSPEVEVQLSRMVAQASQQLLAIHQGQAAQQKAQEAAQDPLVQLQQAELQLKGQDIQRKAAKDAQDADLAREKLRLEQEKIQVSKDKVGVDANLRVAQIEATMQQKKG
jgi:hypothetical protein